MKTEKTKFRVIKLKKVSSTNDYCKFRDLPDKTVVVAKMQTGGKGTKGRSFASDKGGIYLSLVRTASAPSQLFSILKDSCVAVCRTVQFFGCEPVIRWSNDVLVGGKKISGTLIENVILPDGSCRSVVGIGLNVCNKLPEELNDIATTLSAEAKDKVRYKKVLKVLLSCLEKEYSCDDYRSYINWFGQSVCLKRGEESLQAVALDVDENGMLICRINGEVQKISSAEVSLRLL